MAVFFQNIHHHHLFQIQIVGVFNYLFHIAVVRAFVRLGTQSVHSRSLTAVEHAHLNGGGICCNAHFAAQRIQFLDQMALSRSAYCRIARHHRYIIQRNCRKQRFTSHTGSSQCCFASRMTGANDNNVIGINQIHFLPFFPLRLRE